MRLFPLAVAFGAVAMSALPFARTEPPQGPYLVEDLGTLGGATSHASAINIAGQVVGWSATAMGTIHAFLYTDGAMTDLGTLVGGTHSYATALSDTGDIVGYGGINAYGVEFRESRQAFLWRDGRIRPLGSLYCACSFNERYGKSAAYGVSADGRIVGESGTVRGSNVPHAFVWTEGAMRDLDPDPASSFPSYAYAINSRDQIAGRAENQAALWQTDERVNLGALPGHTSSVARALNAAGQVVGESLAKDASSSRAVLWSGGVMQDLGVLAGDQFSEANGINASAQIVGSSTRQRGAQSRAFLWQNGKMSDLNSFLSDASWLLTTAEGINDSGQIVGSGQHNGQLRAFRLNTRRGGLQRKGPAKAVPSADPPDLFGDLYQAHAVPVLHARPERLR